MLNKEIYQKYVEILKAELVPAMGCTEPVALAYAAAKAKQVLKNEPTKCVCEVSGNILKNVKSVIVPHTGKMVGIPTAIAAGIAIGDPDKELEVLCDAMDDDILKIKEVKEQVDISVKLADSPHNFDIAITLTDGVNQSYVRILDEHTNIVCIKFNDDVLYENYETHVKKNLDKSCLNVKDIILFADELDFNDVKETLDRQIKYNMAIAEEGLTHDYGANIGKVYLQTGKNLRSKIKAYAAAGSDARMNGCEMPVIINSGSGNQGMTCSIPVIVYAREKGFEGEALYKALAVSNLVTLHLKKGIGTLSAYCGVVSAGAGAACGIAYLMGGRYEEISHVIVNSLAIDSGIVCDGAKASCAAKIAMAVESGLLGLEMYFYGNEFNGGEGIVTKGVENTIDNVTRLAHDGMKQTDQEIIKMMIKDLN